ncbi:MAG: putative bifunctional diguanylate cyclase/phosphodiesterase [Pelagimonas sp.]|uniref:putative bifunctional diguanylate cyclase/phosphodiesterase n=1 Tax=Pelagimonas sp. TaxID=2073170 RepID=UPI003D6B3DDD
MSIQNLEHSYLKFTSVPIVVLTYDLKAKHLLVTYANAAFTDALGWQACEVPHGMFEGLFDEHLSKETLAENLFFGTEDWQSRHKRVELQCLDGTKLQASATLDRIADAPSQNPQWFVTFSSGFEAVKDGRDTPEHCSYERLLSALNSYPDPIVIYGADLRLVSWNQGYASSVTDDPDELVFGMHLRDVLYLAVGNGRYPEAIGREDDWVNGILSKETLDQPHQDVELDGDIHHRLLRSRSANGDYVVVRLNSTELVRQKRTAEAAKARLESALNAYPSPFVIYDSDDCLVVWNQAYQRSMANADMMLEVGMHRTEVARSAINAGKIVNAVGQEDEWNSDEHQSEDVAKPVQDIETEGDIHHRLLRSRSSNGDLVIVRLDITELVRQKRSVEQYAQRLEDANQAITHMAFHDDLTCLGNRRYLKKRLTEFNLKRNIEGGEITVLHIDLDRFKQINDTMGHATGDAVLVDVANRICGTVEPNDVVARIGGDEFVVLIYTPFVNDRAEKLAETLIEDLSHPAQIGGKVCRFGASVGMAQTPLVEVSQLLTNSDVALYKAKRRGRGQLGVFSNADLEAVRHNKRLADDILRGIEQAEFVPFYQPQIDARSGALVGLETLARWRHPSGEILSPSSFLPVASDLQVTAKIDKIIFEKAILECSRLFRGRASCPSLSFNASTNRIGDGDILQLRRHVDLYPGQIAFELLETTFLEEQDDVFMRELNELRNIGIEIEVDDFGSGRASVIALQKVNPDRLKIDRRIVAATQAGDSGLRLLRSIVEIGHTLEIGVTAEGVETEQQSKDLAALGCDRLQGFFIGKPVPFSDLTNTYWANSLGSNRQLVGGTPNEIT